MADLKISQLTAATTPLAGTEVLPIVQSSTTVKVAVSDLTAGRAISATAATLSSGNLNFSSTAQRITGDFSNATAANRLSFQSSTVNGNTIIQVFPNGTGTVATSLLFNSSDSLNSGYAQLRANASEISFLANAIGTGTFLPMTFYTGGSERVRIDTTGRVGIGATPSVAGVQLTVLGGGTQLSPGTTAQEGVRIQRATGYATLSGINNDNNAYNGLQFFTSASAAVTIDTSGNVGIGTSSNLSTLTVNGSFAPKGPSTVNAATYSVAATDYSLRFTTTDCTVTLPAAASYPGRILVMNTITANSVTSNASNVIPLGSNSAGTAILAATAGKFVEMQSDGTNWIVLMSN